MSLIEFKDLPDTTTPLTASNLNKIQESNVYSTNEVEIGKWIDNKPLYRKVFTGSITQAQLESGTYNINTSLNVDFCVVEEAILDRGGTNYDILTNNTNLANNNYFTVFYRKSNNTIQFRGNAYSGTYYIILEYTKSN